MYGLIGPRCMCGHILMPVTAPDGGRGMFCPNCKTVWVKPDPTSTPEATNVRAVPEKIPGGLTGVQRETSERLLRMALGDDESPEPTRIFVK